MKAIIVVVNGALAVISMGVTAAVGIFFLLLVLLLGAGWIAGGYWVSDLLYDAGLWPLGAIARIFLLFTLLGYLVSLPFYFFGGIIAVCKWAWETSKEWRIATLD